MNFTTDLRRTRFASLRRGPFPSDVPLLECSPWAAAKISKKRQEASSVRTGYHFSLPSALEFTICLY